MRRYSVVLFLVLVALLALATGCGSSDTAASETTAPTVAEDTGQEWAVNQTKKLGELDVTLHKVTWKDGVLAYDIEFKNPTTSAVDLNSTDTLMKFITYTDKGQQFERAMMNSYKDPLPDQLQPGVSVRKLTRITSNESLMEANTKKESITPGTKVVNLIVEADAGYQKPKNKAEFTENVDL